jgi:glycosyltransferase involved in cell wall biosynthesis
MMHLFINAAAASAGGGLTYIRNIVPHIASHQNVRATILLEAGLARDLRATTNITLIESGGSHNSGLRFLGEQYLVPRLIRKCRADVLISTGNFAIADSPVPQILLSRNALYTSRDFLLDVRFRGDYRLWLDHEAKSALARWSIHAAEVVVAPSEAFARELRLWTGKTVTTIHHGFDHSTFAGDHAPLPDDVQKKLKVGDGALRLLFVSHYNYYRNFEALIRALPLIKAGLHPRKIVLFLTCNLGSHTNSSGYHSESAAALVRELRLENQIVELGVVPYQKLHQVYRTANIYVTPAYAESFAHPLVEAMGSGLPIVASDLTVHREVCGDTACYFHRFSPQELANKVLEVAASPHSAAGMSAMGKERAAHFSWKKHAEQMIALARQLTR